MRIARACVDPWLLQAIREHALGWISRIDELSPAARSTWALQSGINLSDIPCPALGVLAGNLSSVIGLPCSLRFSSVRLQACTGDRQLRWHQDCAPMQLVDGQRGEVAWVPLDEIDGTRPTLEVADVTSGRAHERDDRIFLVIPGAEFIGDVLHRMSVGDVAFFSPYAPHRTYVTDAMTESRLSLDLRFAEGW